MIKIVIFFMAFTLSVFANDYMKEDGTFDWESYLESDVKQKAYNDTNTLIQLFNYYDKVKDDPFSLGTLSNDIVNRIYNSDNFFYRETYPIYYGKSLSHYSYGHYDVTINNNYGNRLSDDNGNSYYDTDTNIFYSMYQILYDNIHKFDFGIKKEKKQATEWFLNNQIHEVKLFNEIRNAYLGEENKLIEIKLRNSGDEVNGLVIKYNGKPVAGILGERRDFEYTIDYNGKKDVKVRSANIKVSYLDKRSSFLGVRFDDENAKPEKYNNEPFALIIDENKYYMYASYTLPTSIMRKIFETEKIRDLNNHEDDITRVEIIK